MVIQCRQNCACGIINGAKSNLRYFPLEVFAHTSEQYNSLLKNTNV